MDHIPKRFGRKKFQTFFLSKIFEKTQSCTFEYINISFGSEFDADSEYNQIYMYLQIKLVKNA